MPCMQPGGGAQGGSETPGAGTAVARGRPVAGGVAPTFRDGPQDEDARLLDDPLGVEEELLEQREEVGEQLFPEDVGQDVQRGSRALPCRAGKGGRG